jgi:hypothetical protein
VREPLRSAATSAVRAVAARLRTDLAYFTGGPGAPTAEERAVAAGAASAAVAGLRRLFVATPYRPTALGTEARALVRLVDELTWLDAIVTRSRPGTLMALDPAVLEVKSASAEVLERCAAALERESADGLAAARERLHEAVLAAESASMVPSWAGDPTTEDMAMLTALDPTFRAQEIGFAVDQVAGNVALSVAAERRSLLDRLLGRPTSRRIRYGCTTASAARSAWASPCSSRTWPASSTPSGWSSAPCPSCVPTR